jgi:hypothetical protein
VVVNDLGGSFKGEGTSTKVYSPVTFSEVQQLLIRGSNTGR